MNKIINSRHHRFPYFFWKEFRYKLSLGICYVLLYEILLGLVIYPLLMNIYASILARNGFYYITDQNWIRAFLRPSILICSILIAFLFVFFGLFQIVSIITLASEKDIYTIRKLLIRSIGKLCDGFRVQKMTDKICIFIFYPIINWVSVYSLNYKFKLNQLFNFGYVNDKWILFSIMVCLNFAFLFVYPMVFIEKIPFLISIRKGFQLFLKNPYKNVRMIIFLVSTSLLVPVLSYLLIISVLASLISFISVERVAYGYALTAVNSINIIFLYVISTLTSIISIFATVKLYNYRRTNKKEVDIEYSPQKSDHRYSFVLIVILTTLFVISLLSDTYFRNITLKFNPYYAESTVEVIAHRGLSTLAPENTLSAIEAAIENGADRIEIDVQLTKDGQVVLMHDKNTRRTTGVDNQINTMTLAEVKKLDAGSWFSGLYRGEKVPTLEEVLEVCKNKVNLMIELKPLNGDAVSLAKKVVEKVQEMNMQQSVIITSFHNSTIKQVQKQDGALATGMIVRFVYGSFDQKGSSDSIIISSKFVTERLVQMIHASGKRVFCWTVNSHKEIIRLTKLGVDGIITDYPIMAREKIYEEKVPPIITQLVENLIQELSD